MQCYERQAMYLNLYASVVDEHPGLPFDPCLLDEILCDSAIDRFNILTGLDRKLIDELVLVYKLRTAIDTYSRRNKSPAKCDIPVEMKGCAIRQSSGMTLAEREVSYG